MLALTFLSLAFNAVGVRGRYQNTSILRRHNQVHFWYLSVAKVYIAIQNIKRRKFIFRLTKFSITAVSVVCLGLFGCGGEWDDSSGGPVSGGSGKVISCDVKTSQAGIEAETCSEIPESSPIAETFKQICETQSVAGVSTATVGTGCPAAQKKCTIEYQTIYYYGEAAKFATCADNGNDSCFSGNSGSSNNSVSAQTGNVYSCSVKEYGESICIEIPTSSKKATELQAYKS